MGLISRRASPPFAAAALALVAVFAAAPPARAADPGATLGAAAAIPSAPGAWTPAPAAPPAAASPAAAPGAAAADASSAEDIRDIRGPKTLWPAWVLPALLAGVVLLAAGAYAAWRWARKRKLPRPLLPFEIALQRLEAARALMHPSTVREFSGAISDIVRGHIEYAFDVTATQRTTEEFLHDLLGTANTSLATHRGLLEEFLQRCDMAKFAGVTLSRQIMEKLYDSARRFVIQTSKPAAAAPAEAPAPARPSGIAKEAHDSLSST